MKKILLPVCALVLSSFFTSRSAGQAFVGSDNFDSGSASKWAYTYRFSGTNGLLTFTNARLDFSKDSGAGSRVLGWDGDPASGASRTAASSTTSWIAELTVTNTLAQTGGEFGTIGFQIAGSSSQFSALMLGSTGTGFILRSEGSGTQSAFSPVIVTTSDSTDVRLRLSWDAGLQALTSSYSFDSGATYTSIAAASPISNWSAGTANSGFFFEVFGNSNSAAAITSGSMFADNFSVSAIPEPSTYAAMAGAAALGLAFWRRRNARNATKI